jgi:hypothetical protein
VGLAACLMVALAFCLPAEDAAPRELRQYRAITEGKVKPSSLSLQAAGTGWLETKGDYQIEQSASFVTSRWTWRNTAAGTDLSVVREGDTLVASGKVAGKAVQRRIGANGRPWGQDHTLFMEAFVLSGAEKTGFVEIFNEELKLYEFDAKRVGQEKIRLADREWQTVKVHLSLTGALAGFWGADYWFDAATGRFLRCDTVLGGPGTPRTIIEAVL